MVGELQLRGEAELAPGAGRVVEGVVDPVRDVVVLLVAEGILAVELRGMGTRWSVCWT